MYVSHFGLLASLYALAAVPGLLINLALWYAQTGVRHPTAGATPMVLLADFLFLLWAWAAIILATDRLAQGREVSALEAAKEGLARFWSLLGTMVLAGIAVFVGWLAFVVPGLLLLVWFALAPQASVLTAAGVTSSLRLSAELARGRFFRILGVMVVSNLPGLVLSLPLLWYVMTTRGAGALPWWLSMVQAAASLLVGAFPTVVLTLLFRELTQGGQALTTASA